MQLIQRLYKKFLYLRWCMKTRFGWLQVASFVSKCMHSLQPAVFITLMLINQQIQNFSAIEEIETTVFIYNSLTLKTILRISGTTWSKTESQRVHGSQFHFTRKSPYLTIFFDIWIAHSLAIFNLNWAR